MFLGKTENINVEKKILLTFQSFWKNKEKKTEKILLFLKNEKNNKRGKCRILLHDFFKENIPSRKNKKKEKNLVDFFF
jgi:hypothetical protein